MVTVVMTTCKRSVETVTRAVLSVTVQTYKDWELIVIDDSPNTFEYREEVKKHVLSATQGYQVTYIFNSENRGACFSRNIGLNLAKGEYIAFLDDDDEWLPEKLQEQIDAFKKADADTAMIYGPFFRIDEQTGRKSLVQLKQRSGYIFSELLQEGNFIGGMSMPMIKTESVRNTNGFDNDLQSAQDYDLWLRISQKYRIEYLSSPLVLYYVHKGEQITGNPSKKIQGLERINEKYRELINSNPELWYKRHMIIIPYYAANREIKKAFATWLQGVKKKPIKVRENSIFFLQMIRVAIFGKVCY